MVAGTRNIGTQATINSAHTHGRIIGKVHTLPDKGSKDFISVSECVSFLFTQLALTKSCFCNKGTPYLLTQLNAMFGLMTNRNITRFKQQTVHCAQQTSHCTLYTIHCTL